MKKTLIIAEKNAVAKDIKEAIEYGGSHKFTYKTNATSKKPYLGYYENPDYKIVSCFGHMLQLKDPEEYDKKYSGSWKIENLPIYFPNWEISYKKKKEKGKLSQGNKYIKVIDKDVKRKLEIISSLMKETNLIIHAGDNDDEGQLLVDEILDFYKFKGEVKRLIINDNNKSKIIRALNHLQPNSKHRPRGESAHARRISDLVVGINLSQMYTLKKGSFYSVGRVQTPTLGLIVSRDLKIEGHKKQKYYDLLILINNKDYHAELNYIPDKKDSSLTDGKFFSKEPLIKIEEKDKKEKKIDIKIEEKEKKEKPPLPLNLAKLQGLASKLYSYSLKETLNITQHLREKYKAITYNRVATRYLPENLHEEAPTTLNTPIKYFYNGKIEGLNFKQKSAAFDSSKIVDHHGIIPAGKPDISQFNEKELNVYKLIVDYYIYQFLPPSIYIKRTLSGEVKGYKFSSTKSNLISKGYLVITKPDEEQANINSYKNDKGKEDFFKFPKGKSIIEDGEIIERETSPPKRYTEESLLLDMTRISKFVEDKELKNALLSKDKEKPDENGSIGTPATRHTILDTLLDPRRGYVEKQGKNLISTQKGRDFIKFVPKEISSPTLTAKWWLIQEQITEGKTKKETLIENVRDMTFAIVEKEKKNLKIVPLKAEGEKKMNELICKCPFCGKNVYEKEKVFACENSGKDINGKPKPCSFVWYKNNKWWNSKGIKVDKKLIKIFAEEGLTQTFKTLKSPKTGKTYTGVITVSKALPSSPWQTVKLDMEFL